MENAALFTIFLTNLLLILTPGPYLALMISRCARGGMMAGVRIMLGALLVTLLYLGLAFALAQAAAELEGRAVTILGWIGIPVLFWLSWRTFTAAPVTPTRDRGARDLVEGMLLTASSPTMLIFYVTLLPRFLPEGPLAARSAVSIAAVILLGEVLCGIFMILLGTRAMALGPRARRWIDIGAAGFLGLSATSAAMMAFLR